MTNADIARAITQHLSNPGVRAELAKDLADSPSRRVLFEYLLEEYIERCGQEHGDLAVMSAFVAVLRRRESKFDLMQRQACDYETALTFTMRKRSFKGHTGQTIRKKLAPWVTLGRTFSKPEYWVEVLENQTEGESE